MCCPLRKILLFLFALPVVHCAAQDSTLSRLLLQRISFHQLQNTATPGNFPSFISNHISSHPKQKDDNVFFAALINYVLQRNSSFYSAEERYLIDSIQQRTKASYPHFQNRTARLTYNFWRTDTAVPFPYTKWIRVIKKNTSLPDDMDDTVLSLMAQEADSASAAEAHHIMQAYVNDGTNKTIEKKYRSYKAYSVWYGKRFPPVFDVCVLCNVLTFVQQFHLDWTSADSASLQVIIQAVKSGDYIDKPRSVSPYYGNTSIILYHLARLMDGNSIPALNAMKTELLITATRQLQNTDDLLEKVILSSVIMKWGYKVSPLQLPDTAHTIKQIETSPLPFFTGNIPSYFPPFYRHLFIKKNWLLFYHYNPAYNDALLFEYLSLLKQNE